MKKSLVWFTTDLRVTDNETLIKAIETGNPVLAVYCLDTHLLQAEQFGFRRTSTRRLNFLMESLKDLDAELRSRGSGLQLLVGDPEVVIPEFVLENAVYKVFTKKQIAPEEKRTQKRVAESLIKLGVELETTSTSTLYLAQDLPFSITHIPDLFTQFRKRVERDGVIRPAVAAPSKISGPEIRPLHLPHPEEFGFESVQQHPQSAFPFSGGESQAWKRLHDYLFDRKLILTYKETRNGLVGESYSSKFSPWLALGCISPRSIYWQIQQAEEEFGANESTYWLVFELLWRDFFRFMMKKHGAKYFLYGGLSGSAEPTPINRKMVHAWINGETGDDFVDANMKELAATGFMSNRGRQNVASYFCKVLKQDWRVGAAYFESQLLDYDPSSNYGNWAYLAGVGNDTRADRVFNTQTQASHYDPDQSFRRAWLTV